MKVEDAHQKCLAREKDLQTIIVEKDKDLARLGAANEAKAIEIGELTRDNQNLQNDVEEAKK